MLLQQILPVIYHTKEFGGLENVALNIELLFLHINRNKLVTYMYAKLTNWKFKANVSEAQTMRLQTLHGIRTLYLGI